MFTYSYHENIPMWWPVKLSLTESAGEGTRIWLAQQSDEFRRQAVRRCVDWSGSSSCAQGRSCSRHEDTGQWLLRLILRHWYTLVCSVFMSFIGWRPHVIFHFFVVLCSIQVSPPALTVISTISWALCECGKSFRKVREIFHHTHLLTTEYYRTTTC